MTLVVGGGIVVTSLAPPEVVAADLVVEGERVVRVGGADEAQGAGAPRLDASGALVLPGLVCAHTHAYSALARGMPYRLASPPTFLEVLRRVWWRLDRALDLPLVRASARVAALEALLAGTTTLVDHHASPTAVDGSLDVLAEAFDEVGIRSVVCYETSDRDGRAVARQGITENGRFLRRVALGETGLARAMVGAHASFTLSDETLAACAELAADTGAGVHVHVAEDALDERDAEQRHGCRVAERLDRAGVLGPRALLAHAVHLDVREVAIVRGAGATVVHNPRSNMNNRVGRPPFGLLEGLLALGTDGIGADLVEESRVAVLRARDDGLDLGGDWALARLADSARVAAEAFEEPALGALEAGAPADLVVLETTLPTPVTASTLAGHWLFGTSARRVRHAVVAGRVVVRDGEPTLIDPTQVAADARREAARLWDRLETIDVHPWTPAAEVMAR